MLSTPNVAVPRLGACHIPSLGFGTYQLYGAECTTAVCAALRQGYRLLDTAAAYKNEELVGAGIRASGVPRDQLFVVVKISIKAMRDPAKVRASILQSILNLGIDYADAVMPHWPGCAGESVEDSAVHTAARVTCWQVMRQMQQTGHIRYLAVSNFLPRHCACLDVSADERTAFHSDDGQTDAVPCDHRVTFNQIELHPLCVQADVASHAANQGYVLQQYSPLGNGNPKLLRHPKLLAVVKEFFPGSSVYDVLIMWGLSQGYCTLVRSKNPSHITANYRAAMAFFSSVSSKTAAAPSTEIICAEAADSATAPRPLSALQLEVLRDLRERMGVAKDKDLHLCWYSEVVA